MQLHISRYRIFFGVELEIVKWWSMHWCQEFKKKKEYSNFEFRFYICMRMNQQPSAQHPLEACYDEVIDEPQLN
jgi:hypothetical protein